MTILSHKTLAILGFVMNIFKIQGLLCSTLLFNLTEVKANYCVTYEPKRIQRYLFGQNNHISNHQVFQFCKV